MTDRYNYLTVALEADMRAQPVKILLKVADRLRPLTCFPPPQHWLNSDATCSYCWGCARKARWEEMGLEGDLPADEGVRFDRSKVEEEICSGIDGGSWYSGESDTPQACETCGVTLAFHLTAYGVSYTIEGFEADSIDAQTLSNPDAIYSLREMLEQGAWVEDDNLVDQLKATATVVRRLLIERHRRASTGTVQTIASP